MADEDKKSEIPISEPPPSSMPYPLEEESLRALREEASDALEGAKKLYLSARKSWPPLLGPALTRSKT